MMLTVETRYIHSPSIEGGCAEPLDGESAKANEDLTCYGSAFEQFPQTHLFSQVALFSRD
jgi:hypothetical protein